LGISALETHFQRKKAKTKWFPFFSFEIVFPKEHLEKQQARLKNSKKKAHRLI
jgi:hypothetical protein